MQYANQQAHKEQHINTTPESIHRSAETVQFISHIVVNV